MDENKDNIVDIPVEEKKEDVVIIISSTLNLVEAGEKVIEEKNKATTTVSRSYGGSNYNYSSYNAESDLRTVYFYELSNLDSRPLSFFRVSKFVEWCKEHGVLLSEDKISTLKKMPTSYSICKPGQSTIITRVSRYMLEQAFNEKDGKDSDYGKPSSVGCSGVNREEGSYPYCSPYDKDYYGEDWY